MSSTSLPYKFVIDASGGGTSPTTAIEFTSGGGLRFVGAMGVSGDASVSGRITSDLGAVVLTQQVTVTEGATAGVTAAKLPAGASILNIHMVNNGAQGIGTAAATVDLMIGNSSDDKQYGILPNVSASNASLIGNATPVSGTSVSGKAFDLAAAANVIVKTTAVSGSISAASTGQKVVSVVYIRRQ